MKIGTVLLITHDVVEKLVGMGLLTNEGDFTSPNLQQDLELVQVVESCAKARGVVIQSEIDKIISILPLVASLAK